MKVKCPCTESKAIEIRRQRNPDTAFSPGLHFGDLFGKTYIEIVDAFRARIYERYIDPANHCNENNKYNFTVLILCCVILDLLSQYFYGKESSGKLTFIQFIREYIPESGEQITPSIESCYFKKEWTEETINDAAEGFYHCFRSGVVHSAMVLEYGRINEEHPNIVHINKWGKGKREIVINPSLLLSRLIEIFDDYIAKLRNNEQPLKDCFKKKFAFDFGVEIDG